MPKWIVGDLEKRLNEMKDNKIYYTRYSKVGAVKETTEYTSHSVDGMFDLLDTMQVDVPRMTPGFYLIGDRTVYSYEDTVGAISDGFILSTNTTAEMNELVERLNSRHNGMETVGK